MTNTSKQFLRRLETIWKNNPRSLIVYWRIGREIKAQEISAAQIPGGHHGSSWRKKLGENLGLSVSTLNKCLQFQRWFDTEADIDRLVELKVSWTQLSISFGVRDRNARTRLLARAKKELWNVRELQREVQRINGTHGGGGRKRKERKSHGLLADVVELGRLSKVWNEFYEEVATKSLDGRARGIDVDVLRNQLEHSSNELAQLQKAVLKAIKSIGTLSKKLPEKSSP